MGVVISAKNLGKKYIIGQQQYRNMAFREVITKKVESILKREARLKTHDFWALKNVSLEIEEGDRIGILGRNGAGKSTLLKLISRITEPTTGSIDIKGRVASLLEVGTGFHQELTGRENIFLNGAVLGMSKAEINRKFGEIVEFSGVEKFLDVPVKRYSSGMYVRLAFSVAAHLEPDILIVDEVLAVGDAQFQKKCLNKMEDAGRQGRTVLFVSHNTGSLTNLCNKGIYIENGQTEGIDNLDNVIGLYLGNTKKSQVSFKNRVVRQASIRQIRDKLEIYIEYKFEHKILFPNLGFVISDNYGRPICGSNPIMSSPSVSITGKSSGTVTVIMEYPKLLNGTYRLSLWFGDGITDYFTEMNCITFDIINMVNTRQWPASEVGPVSPVCKWIFE